MSVHHNWLGRVAVTAGSLGQSGYVTKHGSSDTDFLTTADADGARPNRSSD